jgi:peptidyl-prolyl isomerase G (cyclophilin G)
MSSASHAVTGHDNNNNGFCFLHISIAGGHPQRIVIQLFRSIVPKTCDNFASLCAAPGRTTPSKPIPTYRGSIFHRVVPQFMVQGGDFTQFSGTGGHAANGGTFADESFQITHDCAGVVSMANKGKDTNGSQFFITLQATPHLNNKHVAFGRVIEGMNVVQSMATDVELEGTKPTAMQKIVIVDCGLGKGTASQEDDSDNSTADDNRDRRASKKADRERKKSKRKEDKSDGRSKRKRKEKKKHSSDEKRHKKEYSLESSHNGKQFVDDTGTDCSSVSSKRKKKRKSDDHQSRDHSSRKRNRSKSSSERKRRKRSNRDEDSSVGSESTTSSSASRDKGRRDRKSRH